MFTNEQDHDDKNDTAPNASGMASSTTAHGSGSGSHGSRNHNFLTDCAATVLDRFSRAKESTRQGLEHLRAVGDALNEAKEALASEGKGAFGAWCEAAGFPFDRAWRARLMKLAAHWTAIMEAVEALPEDKRKWSVDGVLAIWTAAHKQHAASEAGEAGEGAEAGEGTAKERKETKAERLERMLQEALERIANLEAENARLKATKDKAKGEAKAEAKPDQQSDKGRASVNAATRARAAKVWALYSRPGTEGEKQAAKERLDDMAAKAGLDFDAFVAACGLV